MRRALESWFLYLMTLIKIVDPVIEINGEKCYLTRILNVIRLDINSCSQLYINKGKDQTELLTKLTTKRGKIRALKPWK